jgi:hypothetical protein
VWTGALTTVPGAQEVQNDGLRNADRSCLALILGEQSQVPIQRKRHQLENMKRLPAKNL